jgi:Fuc2NAc and GlcNAc transferase
MLVSLWNERTALEVAVVALGVLLASALITGVVLKLAVTHGVIDVPNERSSHQRPTPRGGGLAIVVGATSGLLVLTLLGITRWNLFVALAGGGSAVAAVGFIDDRRPLSVRMRMAVHVGSALWALAWLGNLPPLQLGTHLVSFGWLGYVLGLLAIVWVLNLFNFMDGIDGIAASEAIFIFCGALLVAFLAGGSSGTCAAAAVFGAACLGFAVWNWPPARIFMGDVGSGYLGYVIAVLALAAARESPVAVFVWLILGAVFFVDATVTLIRRLGRGERIHAAHRSHAYQWLARRWRSHLKVTSGVLFINIVWVLPCAVYGARHPERTGWMVLIVFLPLIGACVAAGSGRRETPTP